MRPGRLMATVPCSVVLRAEHATLVGLDEVAFEVADRVVSLLNAASELFGCALAGDDWKGDRNGQSEYRRRVSPYLLDASDGRKVKYIVSLHAVSGGHLRI